MGSSKVWARCAGAVLLLAWGGCGKKSSQTHGSDDGGGGGETCTEGEASVSCVVIGQCLNGTKFCMADLHYSPCECPYDAGPDSGGAANPSDGGSTRDSGAAPADAGNPRAHDSGMPAMDAATRPPDAGSPPPDSGHTPPPVPEDCGNGVDDDGDGKIDCADSDCSAWSCTAAAPDGWTGPAVLALGNTASACGGDYATETLRGGTGASGDPAVCSSCTCDSATCASFLDFGAGTMPDCSDAVTVAETSASCVEVSSAALNPATVYMKTQLPPSAKGCTPSPQTPTIADAAFTERVRLCGPSATLRRGGCMPSNLCAPATPFTGPICISKTGDNACPGAPYSAKRIYYTAIDDTRDCSPCSCGGGCNYTWQIYADTDTSCGTPAATKTAAGECAMVSPSGGKIRVGAAASGDGSCTASGGQATGAATAAGPVTVCCLP